MDSGESTVACYPLTMTASVDAFVSAVQQTAGPLLVLTGAGVSLASGIPTFRGSDVGAVWKRDVTELGTLRYFNEEPEGSWSWYLARFDKVQGAKPNAGHTALVELEQWYARQKRDFLLVTQNIDGLHSDAGAKELVEVHGSARFARCNSWGCRYAAPKGMISRTDINLTAFRAAPTRANVPRCPECSDFLRQHVLWFDEYYNSHEHYQWNRVLAAVENCALVLCVGTSFSVGVTHQVLISARARKVPVFNIDPSGVTSEGIVQISEPSESVLPRLLAALR